MDSWFPTFRHWLGMRPAFPFQRPWRTSWMQRRSLLRLITAATEENLPLSPLVESWAADESGIQKHRLHHLASVLKAGKPLADAVEEVPGVLSDEDILAIRFGVQSGTLAASVRDRLNESQPMALSRTRQLRKPFAYCAVVLAAAAVVMTFWFIKILPEFEKILSEFSISAPTALVWSIGLANFVARFWYLWVLVAFALLWLTFSAWPGRRLRSTILSRFFRPLRELRTAEVLRKLSVATQAGRPIPGAVSTLARYHYDPTLRHRLLFVRNEMEQGADVWQSMAAAGLLTPPEVRVLETAGRVGNRPWALKQLALARGRRTERRLAQLSEMVVPGMALLLGAFVLLQALAFFGTLVQIIDSLL